EKMIKEYCMGEHIYANENENELVMNNLYNDTAKLISSLSSVMQKVESDLNEFESISKKTVKEYLNEVL
ncbi:MAG: ATP-dependent metallopeptidase FtsH/Yme1/Tma family protein, partial [Thiovulaceae bacterium]|nr:ATP-dependent metallopeptidase FtsH/Yme1/Tma family protein [Sulfurimonadaceae bacterium]